MSLPLATERGANHDASEGDCKHNAQDDHRNARILAEGLRDIGLIAEDPQTNIVMFDPTPAGMDAMEYEAFAKERGVELFAFDPTRVRMVTHHGIEESHVREVIERLA